jgi:hypothetical protein
MIINIDNEDINHKEKINSLSLKKGHHAYLAMATITSIDLKMVLRVKTFS